MGLFCGSILDQVKEKETQILNAKQVIKAKEAELDALKQEIIRFQNVIQVSEQPTDVKVPA